MSPTPKETENSALCICGSGKKFVQCCHPLLEPENVNDPLADAATNQARSNKTKGYLMHLTIEATMYAAQLYTSYDRSKINIVTMISGDGKQFTNLVTVVPDEPAAFVDTLRLVGNEALASYESNEACTEGLVYALYQEVCAQTTEEIRIPDCLMQYGRDACTKEEYAVHFGHLKEAAEQEERDGVDHWADCGVLDSTAPGA